MDTRLDQRSVRTPSRCEFDDVLQQLALGDDEDPLWVNDESADAHHYAWPHKSVPSAASLYSALVEEDIDACDVFVYDPSLFSPSTSAPASPSGGSLMHLSDRDKPLPTLPPYNSTPSPPSTPRSSHSRMSTPSSSPRASLAPPGTQQPLPRSRPPSTNMGSSRATFTHTTFPSISSTLSLLEEREAEWEKRSGVIVTELNQPAPLGETKRNSSESTILAHQSQRRRSKEPLIAASNSSPSASPKRKVRPTLALATSTSSPQLRELAELANTPASPILGGNLTTSPTSVSPISAVSPMSVNTTIASPRTVRHHVSLVSLASTTPSTSSPLASPPFLLPPVEVEPASRWSMDSAMRPEAMKVSPSTGGSSGSESPQSKPRKRDRLLSLISRGRAGSVGKHQIPPPAPAPTPTSPEGEFGALPSMSHSTNLLGLTHGRQSYQHSVIPMAASPSTSTASTASSLNLPTPADSQCELPVDPFCPASPTFAPSSYLPSPALSKANSFDNDSAMDDDTFYVGERSTSPPPAPTLPLPDPSVPTVSFFQPARSQSAFPFLAAALEKTKLRRRKKKLVVSCLSSGFDVPVMGEGRAQVEAQRREREMKRRCESVVRWCESHGPVRRVERQPDGSLHVYWKDWETADMVCRVSGQVYIKGVGRVSLAWRYVN